MKTFTAAEMSWNVTQDHRQCHSLLDRLDLLSQTGRV